MTACIALHLEWKLNHAVAVSFRPDDLKEGQVETQSFKPFAASAKELTMKRMPNPILPMLVAAASLPFAGTVAFAQTVSIDQLGNSAGMNIQGEVSDVFGNRFVLDDGTGRVLVEMGPERGQEYDIRAGERLTVFGEPDGDGFDAFRIVREDGSEIEVRSADGPPPWGNAERRPASDGAPAGQEDVQQIVSMLEAAGLTDVRLDERKGRHYEFETRDADGREVDIDVFFDGQIKKIDVESDRAAPTVDLTTFLPEAIRAAVAERGIVDLREYDVKRNHAEVDGYDAEGREIEMEIAADGRILKVEIDDDQVRAPQPSVDESTLRTAVEAGGYAWGGDVERKPRHFEVSAVNPEGETVMLHVDLNGEIYKEQLRR
jgi:hypothetical protein